MLVLGFDWDKKNQAKLQLHDLEPDDVEFLFEDGDPVYLEHPTDRRRHIALGFVPDERFVLVVLEYNRTTRWVRVVTAYEPTSQVWWKCYARSKGLPDQE